MKTVIIYKSVHHGNTGKIAKVIVQELGADLLKLEETKIEEIAEYDLIGFGSGIYFGNYHYDLLDLIEKLPNQQGKPAFIFSTSGMLKIFSFHEFDRSIKEKLKAKGFQLCGVFNCLGWDTYPWFTKPFGGINKGRPDFRDLERAREFAGKLAGAVCTKDGIPGTHKQD